LKHFLPVAQHIPQLKTVETVPKLIYLFALIEINPDENDKDGNPLTVLTVYQLSHAPRSAKNPPHKKIYYLKIFLDFTSYFSLFLKHCGEKWLIFP